MKTKLRVLLFFISLSCMIVLPTISLRADTEAPILSSEELPSSSFLKKEKRSIVNTLESSTFIMPKMGILSAGDWNDPFLPALNGEAGFPGNVGDGGSAPLGDVSLPIILSFLVLYIIYRGVTTSKRRSKL